MRRPIYTQEEQRQLDIRDALEDARDELRAEVRDEALIEGEIRGSIKLIKSNAITIEIAANNLGISVEEFKEKCKKYNLNI